MNRAARRAAKSGSKEVSWSRGSDTCPRCGPSDGPWATIARREGQTVKIGRAHECGAIVRWEREVELPGDLTAEEYKEFLDKNMRAGRQAN
jgi:hypothetical protein